MVLLDDRILEHLDQEGMSTPSIMATRLPTRASERRLRERCEWLADAGLIYPVTDRYYEITSWGQLYLRGRIDACHQPDPRGRARAVA